MMPVMATDDPSPPGNSAAGSALTLTRDSIQSGLVHRMIAEHGIQMRVLSPDELLASRQAALAGVDLSAGVWLFGYGSLIWNPAFHFTGRLIGRIWGYHRRFCLWTHLGRGQPERPGLVLGLERGGSCQGVAFHIAPEQVEEETALVWRREMLSDAYLPRWVDGQDRGGPGAGARVRDQPGARALRALPAGRRDRSSRSRPPRAGSARAPTT